MVDYLTEGAEHIILEDGTPRKGVGHLTEGVENLTEGWITSLSGGALQCRLEHLTK